MASVRVFLIRHGEPAALWGDAADPGLSERGRMQAEAAAAALAGEAIAAVATSPMRRCQETAAPLAARLGIEARIIPMFTEVPSPAGGDRRGWLQATFPGAFDPNAQGPDWAACGQEIAAWRASLIDALLATTQTNAIVTHFIAINAALSAATTGARTIAHRPAHASVTEVAIENGAVRLVRLGADVDGGPVA